MSQNKDEPTSPLRPTHAKPETPTKISTKDLLDSSRFATASSRRALQEESGSSRENKYTGCNCSKSQCLKMYCACFSVGKMCDQTCLCQACKNSSDNMERAEAINEVITRDPHAFSRSPQATFNDCTCNCRKSSCLKKYCDCYRRGKQCGETCQCHGCHNREEEDEKIERSQPSKLSKTD